VKGDEGGAPRLRRNRRRSPRLPVGLIVVAVLLAVFAMVRPALAPADVNPQNVSLPASTPLATAQAEPTDVHGGQIVFTCTRDDVNQICRIRADGSGYEQLTDGPSNSYYPTLSSDGRDIFYAVNQYDNFDLFRLEPGILEGARSSRSRLKRLTDSIGNAFSPSVSPAGDKIVFVNQVGKDPAGLWTIGIDGEDPGELFSPPRAIVGAAWSPDGKKIAFMMAGERAFAYEVYLLDAADGFSRPRKVQSDRADLGGSLCWSPQQVDLLVFAGPAAAREIFRLDLATGATTQLTYGGNNASACYSPDASQIVFNSLRNGGQADLFVMRSDGHSIRQLTSEPEPDWQPQWGP
jgi:WD40-like Beta Propeller Repeat